MDSNNFRNNSHNYGFRTTRVDELRGKDAEQIISHNLVVVDASVKDHIRRAAMIELITS